MESIASSDHKNCTKCKVTKAKDRFPFHPRARDGHSNICRDCKRQSSAKNWKKYVQTKQGFIRKLLRDCRSHTKDRVERGRNHSFNLTYDNVIAIDKRQEGKCAISGILLQFQPLTSWQASIDRIDDDIHYYKLSSQAAEAS